MKASEDTKQYSAESLRAERLHGKTSTRADSAVYPVDDDFWRNAKVVMPTPNKASVHLRVDADVPEWLRAPGRGT